MTSSIRLVTSVLRQKHLRPLVLSWLLTVIVENTTWMGVLVYAHQRGGASEVGIVAVVQLIPAMLIAPLASYASDRFDRVRVLAAGNALVGVASGLVAVSIGVGLSSYVVYAAATVLAVLVTFPPPTVSALTPCVVTSGSELTALNVCIGITRNIARAAGPLFGGLLLAIGGAAWIFVASAVFSLGAALLCLPLKTVTTLFEDDEKASLTSVRADTLAGLALLRRERSPRRVVLALGLSATVFGALDVAVVVVALEHLTGSDGLTGVLSAGIGIGGIIGAAASVALVGRRRLAPALLLAGGLQVVPMFGLALPPLVVVAAATFMLCGAGLSLMEIAGQTLLQGITPDDLMARVFGVLEGLRMAGFAIGSLAISLTYSRWGVETGSIVFAAVIIAVLAVMAPGLLRIDRDRPEVDGELLSLVRQVPMFAPLPAYTVEQLLQSFERMEPAHGSVVMAEGDDGDAMYLVGQGHLDISHAGRHIQTRSSGEYVGEVALLFDTPRTATVVAGPGVVLYALQRDPFLQAITGHPRSSSRAHRQAETRLSTVRLDADDAVESPGS